MWSEAIVVLLLLVAVLILIRVCYNLRRLIIDELKKYEADELA